MIAIFIMYTVRHKGCVPLPGWIHSVCSVEPGILLGLAPDRTVQSLTGRPVSFHHIEGTRTAVHEYVVAMTARGPYLAVAISSGVIVVYMYNGVEFEFHHNMHGHMVPANSMHISSDLTRIIVGDRSGTVAVQNLNLNRGPSQFIENKMYDWAVANCVRFFHDDTRVLCSASSSLVVFNTRLKTPPGLKTPPRMEMLAHYGKLSYTITCFEISPTDPVAAIGCSDSVRLLDIETMTDLQVIDVEGAVASVVFCPLGRRVFSCVHGHGLHIYNRCTKAIAVCANSLCVSATMHRGNLVTVHDAVNTYAIDDPIACWVLTNHCLRARGHPLTIATELINWMQIEGYI